MAAIFPEDRRAVEDVLAGRLRLYLGGEEFILPVRSIAANRRWMESLDASLAGVVQAVTDAGDDFEAITKALETWGADQMLDLIFSYDQEAHVLPPREELEERVKPNEVLLACMQIRRVENPLADAGLAAITGAMTGSPPSPAPTSSRSRNGASGRRKNSRVA